MSRKDILVLGSGYDFLQMERLLAGHNLVHQTPKPEMSIQAEHDLLVVPNDPTIPGQLYPPRMALQDLIRKHDAPVVVFGSAFQSLVKAYGGSAVFLTSPASGKTSLEIVKTDDPLFEGVTNVRVHVDTRWSVRRVSDELETLARLPEIYGAGIVKQKDKPKWGFAFHPERTEVTKTFIDRVISFI